MERPMWRSGTMETYVDVRNKEAHEPSLFGMAGMAMKKKGKSAEVIFRSRISLLLKK